MVKKKYIVKMGTNSLECLDPNLEWALNDIKHLKQWHGDEFDFEISCLFDEFIIDYNFDNVLNTFLNDISKEESFFHYVFVSKDYVTYIKKFIVNVRSSSVKLSNWHENDLHLMEAFLYNKFNFRFTLPKSIMTQEKYEDFMYLGADYLIGTLHPEEMLEHLIPRLYIELSSTGLLDNEELKDYGKYQIGLA